MAAGYGHTNGWNRPASRVEYECDDHMCRPVMVDAEGRRRPFNYSDDSYGYAERVIEQIASPVISQYKYGYNYPPSGTEYDDSEGYVTETVEKVIKHVRVPASTATYKYYSPPGTMVGPTKNYRVAARPSSPVCKEAEEFIAKVQTDAGRPAAKPVPLPNASNWHNISNPTGDFENFKHSRNGWDRPGGCDNQNGWRRPGYESWPGPGATSDINKLVDCLNDASSKLEPFSHNHGSPQRIAFAGTVDSKEAARRYGGTLE